MYYITTENDEDILDEHNNLDIACFIAEELLSDQEIGTNYYITYNGYNIIQVSLTVDGIIREKLINKQ